MKLGIQPTDRVLIFMGTIFRFSGLVELLNELAPILQNDSTLKFLILGDGEDFTRLKQHVTMHNLFDQVITPGRIDYEHLAPYLQLGNVALLPFKQDLVTHMALPGKVLQYLACGLPTIAIDLDGLQSLIPPNHGILYVSDLQEMATTVKQLMSDEVFLKDISHLGVSHMIRHFNWEKQISSFENLLFSCCNE